MPETNYVPAFSLSNGISFSGGFVSRDIQHLGTGEPAYKLSVNSLMHSDQTALYFAGFCEKLGIDTGIPEEAKRAALAHYEVIHNKKGYGNWNFDGIDSDVDFKPLPGEDLPQGYEHVMWIKRPEWKEENGIWIPFKGEGSEAFVTEWPPDGYGPLPTIYGFRDPRTGWALATTPDRKKAVKALKKEFEKYMDIGKALKLAEQEVSYSCRRERGTGKGAVYRDFSLGDFGPFYEGAGWGGGGRLRWLGAFPFSSSEEK
jgi:hypothetical protein